MLAVFSVHFLFSIHSHNWFINGRHDRLGLPHLYLAVRRLILLCGFPMALPTSTAPAATGSAEHHSSTSGTHCWDTTCGEETPRHGESRGVPACYTYRIKS